MPHQEDSWVVDVSAGSAAGAAKGGASDWSGCLQAYCRFQKRTPRVGKLFINMSFTLREDPPPTLGEEL